MRRLVIMGVLLCCLPLIGSCRQTPSEEECRASLINFLRLQSGGRLSDELLNRMVDELDQGMASNVCREQKSREQVLCEINAKTIAELKSCEPERNPED
ncbi:MAG: hypothetical protein KDK27_02105 [Leptospiraceae bacterium]|nr:hypothetical protein [Leptospiraceae bacterium]